MTVAPEGFVKVKGFPKWFVSRYGEVWSANTKSYMKPHDNGRGYKQLIYHDKGERKKLYVHRLVAENFIGEIPEGFVVNHIDGDPSNNFVENLEIWSWLSEEGAS